MKARTRTMLSALGAMAIMVAVALVWWSMAGGDDSGPAGVDSAGEPEPPTPTLQPLPDETGAQAIQRLEREGAGPVVEAARAGDVDRLVALTEFALRQCDATDAFGVYDGVPAEGDMICEHHDVPSGTKIPMTPLPGLERHVDEETARFFLEAAFEHQGELPLVFAAAVPNGIGISFALTEPVSNHIFGDMGGAWFNVRPGDQPVIFETFYYGIHSGPKELFQYSYQPAGGEPWYYDPQRSPGGTPPTPDAPPPSP